jgi:hypothetical protein
VAQAASTPSPDEPEAIGGFNLLRRLGGGGMGSVYEAEETATGRRVALKLLLPEYAESPDTLRRFRQEGRLASALSHPRCVFVLAADEDAGRPYIVMELMPGKTLDDLVIEKGPLPPTEAVAKIADVIDGLREAHRLGLVHRDVKPSNCFLEADGRVKVGDFGLAKSLISESRLTRTGTFLGTPLFAAPEQVKMEAVDAQSDVYSVAATLYFLLTGRAPFQSGDTMATLARIVSDDPPSMRSLRPGLPRALDRVVLRGLQRDRKRRWRDLDEFHRALLPFLPAQPSIGGMGLRFGAYCLDCFLVSLSAQTLSLGLLAILPLDDTLDAVAMSVDAIVFLVYFGVLEGLWGWSPAKRLMRLRVGTESDNRPPGVGRAMLRAGVLCLLFNVIPEIINVSLSAVLIPGTPHEQVRPHPIRVEWGDRAHPARRVPEAGPPAALAALAAVSGCCVLLAVALTVSTMRPANGYRGLHEVLSGTRTYRLRWPQLNSRRPPVRRDFQLNVTRPPGMPEKVGPFRIRGALCWTDSERALVGEDPQLGRAVRLMLRQTAEPPLDAAHRAVVRGTRIRWLACGQHGDWQWDAFVAPAGVPLSALTAGGRCLSWAETRPMLEDVADELAAACADGTLPPCLSAEQVWVEPSGRVQLLDTSLTGGGQDSEAGGSDQQRALAFLRAIAITALEGGPRALEEGPTGVRAPVPAHATDLLARLVGVREPYAKLEYLQKDLDATRYQPTEVTRPRRAAHLALTVLLLHFPLLGPTLMPLLTFTALLSHLGQTTGNHSLEPGARALGLIAACTAFWTGCAFLFRGGYAFWRGGIVLRRWDGRKPSRWQCALRALLVWIPVSGLFCLAIVTAWQYPELPAAYVAIWAAGLALMVAYPAIALWSPTRGPHDRLVGTYLVPA